VVVRGVAVAGWGTGEVVPLDVVLRGLSHMKASASPAINPSTMMRFRFTQAV
jgi:hypothetical protein